MPSDNDKVAVVSAGSDDVIDDDVEGSINSSLLNESMEAGGSLCMSKGRSNAEEERSVDVVGDATPCDLCAQSPCDWITFGDTICEECDLMADEKYPEKMIRFHAYKLYTHLRHGVS
jgi:hypothetical protein